MSLIQEKGTYLITVSDASGCSDTISAVIIDPEVLASGFTTVKSTCDVCSGSITATPTGGTGVISISWLDNLKASISQTGNQANNLCAGIYFAALKDSKGCTDTIPVTVEDFGAPDASIDSVDEKELQEYIFSWTNGNPRLTFDICSEIESILIKDGFIDNDGIDNLIERKYLTSFDIAPIDHIRELVSDDVEIQRAVTKLHSLDHELDISDKVICVISNNSL